MKKLEVKEALANIAHSALQRAKDRINQQKEIAPIFMWFGGEGGAALMPQYADNRELGIAIMRKLLRDNDAECYLFIIEAWMGIRTEAQHKNDDGYLPSKDPQRTEAVCVSGATREGDIITLIAGFTREGDVIKWDEVVADTAGQTLSLTGNLFMTERPN
jgi:hypothetical protein